MVTKQERAAAAEKAAAEETARELGRTYFKKDPEALLAHVCRMASALSPDKDIIFAYVDGYISARRQRDEYRKETP
jgi:hypothetical protein